MNRLLSILLGIVSWVAIGSYLIVSSRYRNSREEAQLCTDIRIRVLDSTQHNFITPGMVKNWFVQEKITLRRRELTSINTLEIERFLLRRGFVKSARVYTSMDGSINIELTQRKPIIRFNTTNGYNFYLSEDNHILPAQRHEVSYVPVVSGEIDFPFERGFVGNFDDLGENSKKKSAKNYLFLGNLINFVKFVRGDSFWDSFVVQIDVQTAPKTPDSQPQIRLVPRVGNQVIVLGELDNYPAKLEKLMSFYQHGLEYEGWERYRMINLQYNGLVVCTK